MVFSQKAAGESTRIINDIAVRDDVPDWDDSGTKHTEEWVLVSHNQRELQQIMWDYVGIVRSDFRLERAFRRTKLLFEEVEQYYEKSKVSVPLCQLRNMIGVAYMIISSAQRRKESRGLHFNLDYPEIKAEENHDTII